MKLIAIAAAAAALLASTAGVASATPGQMSSDHRMVEYSPAQPPVGYVQFCHIHPQDCDLTSNGPARIELTPENWRNLVAINDHVNASVAPATDMEVYGVAEWWDYPQDRGDCEDYVLLKRRLLMDLGWPASALLITVVRDERGEGHAVLTVTTMSGDLILDNQHSEIRVWNQTGYSFVRRQSMYDPMAWASLRDDSGGRDLPVSGMPRR